MTASCARAPVRVDAGGGGTDAPPFSVEHGGMVVNFAVQRHAFASVQRLPLGKGVTIYSRDLEEGVTGSEVNRLPGEKLPFLQGFVRRLVPAGESLLLVTESDVPPGAGLGGSGALGVAVVAALDHAFGRERTPAETAQLANDVERLDLSYPGGSQDSFGAALGGINRLEYLQGGGVVPHRVRLAEETRLALEHHSLLVYTGKAHVSGNIHQDIKDSYALEDSPTVDAMIHLRESASDMAVALEAGDLDGYVRALNQSCDHLYRLHPSCDCAAHREIHGELSRRGLILGRKTCGAGGGGFMIVHTAPGKRKQCFRICGELGAMVWPVCLDSDGVRAWSAAALSEADIDGIRGDVSG